MKKSFVFVSMLCSLMVLTTCNSDDDPAAEENGVLAFKMVNPIADAMNSQSGRVGGFTLANPPLRGETTEGYTISFRACVGDIWVSQGEVTAGQPDDLEWVRLTSSTNTELKLFEDYSFADVSIPAGTYKSIKITLRNIFYRYVVLVEDPNVVYELLETNGSWTDACDENDESWAKTNYFGPGGNHYLNDDGFFEIASEGEKLGGFDIEPNKKATLTWRLGAGVTTPCTTYMIDENGNREWDCGVDRMDFVCPPEAIYMWDFLVSYE